ncbi:hypothetical protein N7457_003704 [Penicillium paradoxum]|uniref:uncharacterized protein n=1 Tax=Penicillium paradoxum TaxID=176176 RepID=UPI002548077E|nr:uncharacterized protein N7457_003704 [Penicillium paradoxum]KAJ5788714.1 hypothetical protein N7457_003704 [Penicillium paradoxum]
MAPKGRTSQQLSVDVTAMDAQKPAAGADEIPELRRGCTIPSGRYLANNLPPLHRLGDIFADMASKALELGFGNVLSQLGSRPLRVATMCSGTEAPLLALELIQTGLVSDQQLRISHVFSCEIVPSKQSYIERNFCPPLLFRDITELGGNEARTAYGSSELIPGNLDILVAGTACVDFSSLNNLRKSLQQGGESGATFDGLLRYTEKYRPRMVIQENVRTAPWDQMMGKWEELGYMSVQANVDTKHYYIPQTRERGYMVVIDKRRLEAAGLLGDPIDQSGIQTVAQRVRELVDQFRRPASAPVGLFLLDDEDRRLELIEMRARLESRSETSWDQYKNRHDQHRRDLGLGNERPITRSLPGVNDLKAPDFYWHRFWQTQPERVWETVDMNFLRRMLQSYDMSFKERWIDLSQGVDRGNDSLAGAGIAGCLTPKGIPYVTTRGGPVSGTEALSLQGLPLDRMLLTRETQADLMDMAGNAMSSTVVCAFMLAGLIAVHPILDDMEESSTQSHDTEAKSLLVPNEVYNLVRSNLQVVEASLVDHLVLKANAASSVMYCSCERQTGVQDAIFKCTLCGHTACKSCHGNPTHSYLHVVHLSRQKPSEFIANLKGLLPMKLMLSGLSEMDFERFRTLYPTEILLQFWNDFIQCVKSAVCDVFRFFEIKRGRKWRVIYDGTYSSLFLDIGPDTIQWTLYAKPPKSANMRSIIREILAKPIARMSPNPGSFVDGEWEICSPVSTSFSLLISGQGDQVPSFQAMCGLKDADYENGKVWTRISVELPEKDVAILEFDIRGIYTFLPECGTALGALYRKEATATVPPIFLFLDPMKVGPPDEDACVFALDHSRLPGYDVRMTIAELSPTWRSLNVKPDLEEVTAFCRRWANAPQARLNLCTAEQITIDTLQHGIQISIENQDCQDACITLTLLSASTTIIDLPETTTDWQAWNPEVSTRELKSLAWLFPKIAGWSDYQDWSEITHSDRSMDDHDVNDNCKICNPPTPTILWGRDKKDRITPYENPQEAAIYERAIKSRPSPFLVFRRINEHGETELRFTLNIQALTHQAHGKLLGSTGTEIGRAHWRLLPHAYDMSQRRPGRFTLMNNKDDDLAPPPPNFQLSLREEQLRSLAWMISQESTGIEPFMEEEVEESILPLMPWRAEVKVTMPKVVRGGVLADEVGYGKTAIILGLIDAQYERDCKLPAEDHGLIPTNATLIIVPHNVFYQWASETKKFLANTYNVLAISSMSNIKIQDVQNADIIILSWNVVVSDSYYARLQKFTGTPKAPTKMSGGTGRNFDSWFHDARASLRESVDILRTEGPEAMLQQLEARRRRVHEAQADFTYVPSRRLRGQAFADANTNANNDAKAFEDWHSASDSGYEDSVHPDSKDQNQPSGLEGQRKRRRAVKSVENQEEKRQKTSSPKTKRSQTSKVKRGQAKSIKDDRKDFNIRKGPGQDWRTVKGAFLHAFSFNRLVIDEYTYAGEEKQTSLLSLQARSKWILSGTPGLDEFADIKSIAGYLGIHLGIDDDGDTDRPMKNSRLRNIRKNHTAVEAFQYYQAPHSNAWYHNRRDHAQRFLYRFARQNIANITNIPLTRNLVIIDQSPAEKIMYDTLFEAIRMQERKVIGPLKSILSMKQSGEKSLMMCCVTTQVGEPPWTLEKCQKALSNTETKTPQVWNKVGLLVRQAVAVWNRVTDDSERDDTDDTSPDAYRASLIEAAQKDFDTEVSQDFASCLNNAFGSYRCWEDSQEIEGLVEGRLQKALDVVRARRLQSKDRGRPDDTLESAKRNVRKNLNTEILAQLKQLVELGRSFRLHRQLHDIQVSTILQCQRHGCQHSELDDDEIKILQSCGHTLCKPCIEERIVCPVEGCKGRISGSKIISRADVFNEAQALHSSKLNKLIELINSLPQDELVIVFIQSPPLLSITSEALKAAGIDHRKVTKTTMGGISDFIEDPRPKRGTTTTPSRPKALLLELGSSMAAGLNLQCANHVIFLSPYLASSQHEYESSMTQAIGRARRFGQKKTVHVYHLLVRNTYDVNIYQKAHGGRLIERNGIPALVPEREVLPSDIRYEGNVLPEQFDV